MPCSLQIEWVDKFCGICQYKRHHMVVTLNGQTKRQCPVCQTVEVVTKAITLVPPKAKIAAA